MLRSLRHYAMHHKFRMAVYAMLGGATIICIILVRVRFAENIENRNDYLFLVRNLFLAWIPALISLLVYGLASPRRLFAYLFLPVGCVVWLVFFPNAPHLLTDFQHLRLYHDSTKLWLDVVLVTWFAFTGLFLGLASLYRIHRLARQAYGDAAGWAFVLVATVLSSAGIYAGRFLRFTSMGFLRNPMGSAMDMLHQARDSATSPAAFILLYALFLLFVYVMIHVFGSLLGEDSRKPLPGTGPRLQ